MAIQLTPLEAHDSSSRNVGFLAGVTVAVTAFAMTAGRHRLVRRESVAQLGLASLSPVHMLVASFTCTVRTEQAPSGASTKIVNRAMTLDLPRLTADGWLGGEAQGLVRNRYVRV